MRICIINEFFYPDMTGGTGTLLSDIARSLHDHYDVEIDVITTRHLYRDPKAKLSGYENWNGINIRRLASPNFNRKSTALRVLSNLQFTAGAFMQLQRGSYDLVLTATAPPTMPMAAHAYKAMTRTPYIYIIYDLEPDRTVKMKVVSGDSRAARALGDHQQKWLNDANKVVVIGRCMRDYLGEHYGLAPKDIEVIAVGADAERIVPQSKQTRFRAQHGLSGFVVVYGGNFGRYHNFDAILDAAKQLKANGKEITFALVGNGAQEAHIRSRIEAEKICNVRLFPILPQEEMPDLLASADMSLVTLEPGMEGLCVPSKFYPILSSGRPTLAMVPEKSEIALVIKENNCGVQIDQADSARLVKVLSHLSQHPEELEQMGQNARNALVERYSTRHIVQSFHSLFLCVANKAAVVAQPQSKKSQAAQTTQASKTSQAKARS